MALRQRHQSPRADLQHCSASEAALRLLAEDPIKDLKLILLHTIRKEGDRR